MSIDGTMSWMEGYGVPGFFLYPAIALEIILPLFVIIGYKPRISAGLLATFCLATAFIFHLDFTDPMEKISLICSSVKLRGSRNRTREGLFPAIKEIMPFS